MKWLLKGVEHELTEKEANARWCGRPSSDFCCAICDARFLVGDVVRSLYTNSDPDTEISGNPIVHAHHGTADECKDILKEFAKQAQALPKFIRRRYSAV